MHSQKRVVIDDYGNVVLSKNDRTDRDRRAMDADLTVVLKAVNQVRDGLSALDKKLTAHIAAEEVQLADTVSGILKSAFPGGDPDGHRKAHEANMQAIVDRAEFWRKMLFEVTKYGAIGVIGWLFYVVWTAFLQGPTK